jgi:hypothetical protein
MGRAQTVRRRLRSAPPQLSVSIQDIKPLDPALLYTESEVARFLRLKNPKTLAVWRSTGAQPALKYRRVGKNRIVYLGKDVIDYVNAKPGEFPGSKHQQKGEMKHG